MIVSLPASVEELVMREECLGAWWVVLLAIHSIFLADMVDGCEVQPRLASVRTTGPPRNNLHTVKSATDTSCCILRTNENM